MRFRDNNNNIGKLPYVKSLDGIRALAAIMVVLFHSPVPIFQFQFGWAGVNLFFILSGFLITRILINAKHHPVKIYLKNFYIRRILRIFPLYFLYLLLAFSGLLLLNHFLYGQDEIIKQGIADFKRNYPFLLTYIYNFAGIINFLRGIDYHNSIFTGHLWSLSVEEQFYLVFPLIIYYIPVPVLKKLFLFIIFLIPVARLVFVLVMKAKVNDLFWIGDTLYSSTIFQLDTLCVGACLVLFDFTSIIKRAPLYLTGLIILMIIIGISHILSLNNYGKNIPLSSLGYNIPVDHFVFGSSLMQTSNLVLDNRYFYSIPLINIAFTLLILLVINGGVLSRFFENKLLVFIGKISYGIYIYHLGLSYLYPLMIKEFFRKDLSDYYVLFQSWLMVVYLLILFTISYLSYRFFERKFLGLKGKFVYPKIYK